jgi:hypothetical protein
MNNYTKLSYLCKREILNFSKKICKGLKKPEFKLITNMLYGISESGSCHLSKISRALKEDITLKKTIERLSQGLTGFSDNTELLNNYAAIVKEYIDDKTIFVIDGSDVTKPCSNSLENLGLVRDGSTGEIKKGYHTLEIAALTKGSKTPISLYDKVYSSCETGFASEDDEVLKGLKYVSKMFGKKGIRTLDRGYDALTYYEYFLKENEMFIIRSKKNRDVRYKGETRNILDVARLFKGKYRMDFKSKDGRKIECKTSIIPVALPKYPNRKLNLVVVYGFGSQPMLLLTNLKSDDNRLANTIVKVYLMRWRIEEHFRFKKQQYSFEDFRVRSLNSIRTLHRILTMLSGLIGILSEKREESLFVMELIEISKRIYKPKKEKARKKFMSYAIADGIFTVLNRQASGIKSFLSPRSHTPSAQLSFFS